MRPRKDYSESKRYQCFIFIVLGHRNNDLFKVQEKEIKEKDMQIQEGMIKFSIFLSDNEKKKAKYDKRIEEEQRLIV
jgi:hypothetical protein